MKNLNLEEIIKFYCSTTLIGGENTFGNKEYISKDGVKMAMLEFGKQLLELAAENAENEIEYDMEGNFICYGTVNKQSILDTIKQVE